MSFKEYLWKRVIPEYFMVVTFLNIGMFVAGTVFFPKVRFGYDIFFSPLFFGLIGCAPSLVDYFFQGKKANKGSIIAQTAFKLVILEACIIGVARLIGLIDSALTAVIIACMVLVIFVVVCVLQYLQDQALCSEMNKALSDYKAQSDKS